jgi:hypothetical protein
MLELKLVGKSTIIESSLIWLKEIGMIISILE